MSLDFAGGSGNGSFACTGPGGGAVLTAVAVHLFNDYATGNGLNTDPVDNSAKFVFSTPSAIWAVATPTTMNLGAGITLFTIGNANSTASTFTNTGSGGLGGTSYVEPLTDNQTGSLVGNFSINLAASVDAGGFANGVSVAHVSADYTFDLTDVPEPLSAGLAGGGLLTLLLIGRRRA